MWALAISSGFMMFVNIFIPLGFVGGLLVPLAMYVFLIKVLNFKEV